MSPLEGVEADLSSTGNRPRERKDERQQQGSKGDSKPVGKSGSLFLLNIGP